MLLYRVCRFSFSFKCFCVLLLVCLLCVLVKSPSCKGNECRLALLNESVQVLYSNLFNFYIQAKLFLLVKICMILCLFW